MCTDGWEAAIDADKLFTLPLPNHLPLLRRPLPRFSRKFVAFVRNAPLLLLSTTAAVCTRGRHLKQYIRRRTPAELSAFLFYVAAVYSTPRRLVVKLLPGSTATLPHAHTCYRRLELPPYTSYDVLEAKINWAVEEGGVGGYSMR